MTLVEPRPARWTREQYYEMAARGWFRGKRALLLGGEIIEMMPQGNWHSVVIGKVQYALDRAFPHGSFWVRIQMPLDLPDGTSEPEPDVAVVPGKPDDYTQHPSTALLVVEVSDSSLRLDRRKANAYAAAGVPDYWIVNLPDHVVELYRDPVPDAMAEFGHRYATVSTLRPGEFITPKSAPGVPVAIADLLPAHRVDSASL
jgi:Uma2 family endonuclease